MLTSQVPPSIDSKRFLTSYPCSGSPFRSPSTPYLSDNLSTTHTQYACTVCNDLAGVVKVLFGKRGPAGVTSVTLEPRVPAAVPHGRVGAWNRRHLHTRHP